ncbi:glycosyltransferase family 4 protein [Actinoplanes sichuanensis]|uniref:Glycosyltransferase family 4 protein n=1 Tax=Actinoplanes sichuanensis TaxID=512349 RepID=A0ABW4AR60_9ACTN|nr:glycosyltransferase family 4 protein [Actinoplanes sichuanensis]BEL07287.1 glycosyltransferase family 4 protein [Actinoplanes sichuanensis]
MISAPLRIALLSYRSKPHSGGQGIYVRHLSRELVRLGHRVEVFSGPPLPELDDGVELTVLPSLDLYREPDPFRTPKASEFTSSIDVLEWTAMCTGAFPEPLTFSLRAWRHLRERLAEFDVVHDNQCLGYGLLPLSWSDTPLVATIHHPITVDRDLELAAAPDWKRRASLRRWYAFTRMQGRVARRLPWLTTVSQAARDEIVEAFRVPAERMRVIGVGVDVDTFNPAGDDATKTPAASDTALTATASDTPAALGNGVPESAAVNRVVTVASADVPLKGLPELIEAVAKLRADHDVELVVVGSARPDGAAAKAITRLGLDGAVRFVSGISDAELADLFRSATVAAVPSRYEGFSLPAVEAMACGVPLVVTTAGALPEVTGPDGLASLHVPPGDPGALSAAIGRLLDDEALRRRLGAEGRRRAVEHFTWRRTAIRTAEWYADAIAAHGKGSRRAAPRPAEAEAHQAGSR